MIAGRTASKIFAVVAQHSAVAGIGSLFAIRAGDAQTAPGFDADETAGNGLNTVASPGNFAEVMLVDDWRLTELQLAVDYVTIAVGGQMMVAVTSIVHFEIVVVFDSTIAKSAEVAPAFAVTDH